MREFYRLLNDHPRRDAAERREGAVMSAKQSYSDALKQDLGELIDAVDLPN